MSALKTQPPLRINGLRRSALDLFTPARLGPCFGSMPRHQWCLLVLLCRPFLRRHAGCFPRFRIDARREPRYEPIDFRIADLG